MRVLNEIKEEWKPIKGYEGYYEVSNLGKVRSIRRTYHKSSTGHVVSCGGKILKPLECSGTLVVNLYRDSVDGKRNFSISKLVATHFLPDFEKSGRQRVRHVDGDHTNCRIDNLR